MIAMILAGGSGTRLWPYSRTNRPKQFLNLGHEEKSLLQQTYERLQPLIKADQIYIIGSQEHAETLKQQLQAINPQFQEDRLILEPQACNTAPAILLGLLRLPESVADESVVILPSDHLIPEHQKFQDYLQQSDQLASQDWLITFGIQPSRPETGYGYIKSGRPLTVGYEVEKFVEKPDSETAKEYVASSSYHWNAGIFVGHVKTLLEEYRRFVPKLYDLFSAVPNKDLSDEKACASLYQQVVADSFDYAILERSQKVAVLPMQLDWSDLGSWESLLQVLPKDGEGNLTRGEHALIDTQDSIVLSDRFVGCIGVKDLIIIQTDDASLICHKSRSQEVKSLVDTLKAEKPQLA